MKYEVDAPDGSVIVVDLPGSATEDQILSEAAAIYDARSVDVPTVSPSGAVLTPSTPAPGSDLSIGDWVVGAGEAGASLASGMTTGAGGMLYGAGKGLMERMGADGLTPQQGADLVRQSAMDWAGRTTYAPRTEAGQRMAAGVGEMLGQVPPVIPALQESIMVAGSRNRPMSYAGPTASRMGDTVVSDAAQSAASGVSGAVKGVAEAVRHPIETVSRATNPQKYARIEAEFVEDPHNTRFGPYVLTGKGVETDPLWGEALKQGWEPGYVQMVKTMGDKDRAAGLKMLNMFRRGRIDKRYRSGASGRPGSVAGDALNERILSLDKIRRTAGKEIEAVARGMKKQPIDMRPAMDNFLGRLRDIGVKIDNNGVGDQVSNPDIEVGGIRVSLRGSDIEGLASSKRLLEDTFRRFGDTDAPYAYDAHRGKQYLQDVIYQGKRSEGGLSAKTERIVDALRGDINDTLRSLSREYADANDKYSSSKRALEAIQDAVGSKVDFESEHVGPALGLAARKLLSNYQVAPDMEAAIANAEKVARKYGARFEDSVVDQVMMANEFNRMFGDVAERSIQGVMESAIRPGVQAAQGNVRDTATYLLEKGVKAVRGVNEENALAVLEKLLKRKNTITSRGVESTRQNPGTDLMRVD